MKLGIEIVKQVFTNFTTFEDGLFGSSLENNFLDSAVVIIRLLEISPFFRNPTVGNNTTVKHLSTM